MKPKLCHFKESQYEMVIKWAERYSEGKASRAIREMIEYASKARDKAEGATNE
jgi:hypothetical protein